MNKMKIFNDPVYGFINFPFEILYDLIDHRYFQRLRRISQLGLSHYVYPGALHTRFHHALGATHLMCTAIEVLRSKGVEISGEEAEAVSIAILLHDIGHGPFSHALEHKIIKVSHEYLSLKFMQKLNEEFNGRLTIAIKIFTGEYPKKFLHQLVSSQLDMDRMDYLNRDSFFTGVAEGVIGYDRIIKMLAVHNDKIVVEEKGIHSIEKFLMARRIMYWQVYLHKTVLSAEQMLIKVFRILQASQKLSDYQFSPALHYFLQNDLDKAGFETSLDTNLERYSMLDDFDIFQALKQCQTHKETKEGIFATNILNRKIFKIELSSDRAKLSRKADILEKLSRLSKYKNIELKDFILEGSESNQSYNQEGEEILILYKSGEVRPVSEVSANYVDTQIINKFFICYPKEINYNF